MLGDPPCRILYINPEVLQRMLGDPHLLDPDLNHPNNNNDAIPIPNLKPYPRK